MKEPRKDDDLTDLGSDSITFVIASFNDSRLIEKTINSIKVNLLSDDKVIVIDGASTDDTVEILRRIKKTTPHLEFTSEPDSGIYDAWNKALEKVSSTWVCFVGCGDILRSDYREQVSTAIFAHPRSRFIHGVAQMYLWDSDKGHSIYLRTLGRKIQPSEFKRRMRVCHVGALHHLSLFDEMVFSTRYKCVSDYHFLLKKLPALSPVFIDRVLVDMEASGISTNSLFPLKEEIIMKKDIGGYSVSLLYLRMLWSSLKHYLFKLHDYRYRFR